jgi:hypothetical protein
MSQLIILLLYSIFSIATIRGRAGLFVLSCIIIVIIIVIIVIITYYVMLLGFISWFSCNALRRIYCLPW